MFFEDDERTPLETALALLERGFWPIPISPPGPNQGDGKAPVEIAWGASRHNSQSLVQAYRRNPGAGVGLVLGPRTGIVDFEVDDAERAGPTLAELFGGLMPLTLRWSSARGVHYLFQWDERFDKYRKSIIKVSGLEIRVGLSGEPKQHQSVCPPSIGDDGQPRRWGDWSLAPAPLPDRVFRALDDLLIPKPKPEPEPAPKPDRLIVREPEVWNAERRAVAYLSRCEPAISGERGHDKAFKAACKAGPGFDLPEAIALRLLRDVYNPTCQPPWSDRELEHKVSDAYAAEPRRGWLLERDGPPSHPINGNGSGDGECDGECGRIATILERPDDPHRLARLFLEDFRHDGRLTLRRWQEDWHAWSGSRWALRLDMELRSEFIEVVKSEFDRLAVVERRPARKVTTAIVSNALQALAGMTLLTRAECPDQPRWIGPDVDGMPHPEDVIPARNGLVFTADRGAVRPHSPDYFGANVLAFDYLVKAPRPDGFHAFERSIWGDDDEAIGTFHEMLGYLITNDISYQKMFSLIGPTRSGKGTIAKLIAQLVGDENVVYPTLGSFANEFRVASLIGKSVAIFPDARISGRHDSASILERLLSITGGDRQTIDRKNTTAWTGRLTTRFVLMANELPQLSDASAAITGRIILLRMVESFLGREDPTLDARLASELPGILHVALDGLERLRERGRFVQPASSLVLMDEMRRLVSPVATFLEDCCEVSPEASVPVPFLFGAWKEWCEANGRDRTGTVQFFGRWLRAALPSLGMVRGREGTDRDRRYAGLRLK